MCADRAKAKGLIALRPEIAVLGWGMARTVLTFGDSNTYGTPPMTGPGSADRFDAGTRWPRVMQSALGCDLIEEGLPGRTAGPLSDPLMGAHMNGHLGLRIALQSHGPIDDLVVMLGTNDQKAHFGLSAEAIAGGVAGLLALATGDEYQDRHGGFDVLLICPPAVQELGFLAVQFNGAAAKSAQLPGLLAQQTDHWGAGFVDAGRHIATSAIDGVHLDPADHITLGRAVAETLA